MFNIEDHIKKVKSHSDKLITYLKTKGIEYIPICDNPNNIILKSKDKEYEMSHHSFYGFSRMGAVTKLRGEKSNEFDFVPVTDEFYITNILKSIIEHYFNPPSIKK